ncbi:glycosyltransferase [Rhodococcus sp. BP-252]|uniref:Glycosyl transferase n=1 Tax=Rhodococcoides kyotonense TaxID=398843 RepID=A0A177YKI8_9NOCA|nr:MULTISPECIES: glycosyltransferase [Rhodococcus]MBY6413770.1 glycosyltransferase [Rhodococcus sp. BP-320]MBY6418449.1 glycosyltransferase [Rhodococcus sp. BP-321]MBY6422574.1 glycosyltransferase [Rhodococcus sp. BP-324]MBY6428409.1 glycosyltransferase [Rhodococcus sp. BP-323]MBY6433586.1 glycosyltransferase [Rhodococcus sp. BP-322]
MRRATFLLSKDPITEHGGDIALSRLMMQLAREAFEVRSLCLSKETEPSPDPDVTRVLKPRVDAKLLLKSVRPTRSVVHGRYDVDAFVHAIEASRSDVYVAEHSYMAEPFIRSAKFGSPFVINTVNTESQVWKVTRGLTGRIEAPRILRDEIRVARAADAVGTYDADEADMYRSNGVRDARWIDLTLEPTPKLDLTETANRLVFMGTRDWPPNQEAFKIALEYWPRISDGIDDAELCIIGAKATGAVDPVYPPGVRDLGFVDDLQEFLGTCRALIAPVATGGGVRVKILDAASKGLPVVGTSAAVGSLGPVFELPTFDDPEHFVAECRRYLLDRNAAVKAGERIYELNAARWEERIPHTTVASLIGAPLR